MVVEVSNGGFEIFNFFINNICRQNQFRCMHQRRITGPRKQMQQILSEFKIDLVNNFLSRENFLNGGHGKKMGHSWTVAKFGKVKSTKICGIRCKQRISIKNVR